MKIFKNIPDWLLLVIIIGIGAILRILCATKGDFWLDEIWSYNIAFEHSLLGVISLSHDNNHLLNTIFMHLLGPNRNIFVYRIIPLLCGISSLFIIYLAPIYKNRVEKFITLTIFSVSYFFVSYSTEARGYAYFIFFVSLSFYSLHKIFKKPKRKTFYILFCLSAILGILSHYIYLTFYLSALAWTVVYKKKISIILKMYLAPTLFYVFLYFALFRYMQTGGGVVTPPSQISDLAFYELLGFAVPAFVCFFIYLYALINKPKKDDSGIFYLSLFMLVPMAMFMFLYEKPIHERYMTAFLFFFVILISQLIADLIKAKSILLKTLGIILITLIVVGSIHKDIKLYVYGKGDYVAVANSIIDNSNGKERITIATDHRFRNETLLKFYFNKITTNKPIIEFCNISNQSMPKADWLIYHSLRDTAPKTPAEEHLFAPNIKFKLFKEYKHDGGPSGWTWTVYKRVE